MSRVILVTGAEGFIGRAVCARLRAPFTGIDLPCDISDPSAVTAIFREESIDAVIHLAGMLPSACRADPIRAARVNVTGSINLLEAARSASVRRFVFGSSISAYDAADIYGAGKRYIEMIGEASGLSFVALRIATVVGPGARNTASPWRAQIFEKLGTGQAQQIRLPFHAHAVLPLVHVEEVAEMLIILADQPELTAPHYDTPAENWTAGDLKQTIESIDRNVTVELDADSRSAPVLGDGTSFRNEFAWRSKPIAERLAEYIAAARTPA